MERIINNTLEITQVPRGDVTEFFIHAQKDALTTEVEILNNLFDFLSANNALAVVFRVFVSDVVRKQIIQSHAKAFSDLVSPVTWISQNECDAFSIQVQAFSGTTVEPVKHQDTIVGCRYVDQDAEYVQLSFLPDDLSAKNSQQATGAFKKCQQILTESSFDFKNVARTWLFTHDILSWYGELNTARDNFFDRYDIFNKIVPASTGIGVSNPSRSKLAFEALAVNPKNDTVHIQEVDSPLQCAALDYRSSFSRAVHIQTSDHRRILVSGTASIDPDGNTIFINDTAKQIDKSMEVTQALLNNANMGWQNIVRGIMYFKNANEFDLFDDWCRKNSITMPHVKVHADICRDDLLFELEIDAVAL